MDLPCGQCLLPYSTSCQRKIQCKVHKAQCFECLDCEKKSKQDASQEDLILCSVCDRKSSQEDLYYDYQCDSHICRFHFLNLDFTSKEIDLACGDKQEINQILVFMANYCILCGRKLGKKQMSQLGICMPCEKRGFQSSNKANYSEIAQEEKQKASAQPCKQQEQKNADLVRENMRLQTKLLMIQQSYKVSEFTRNEIKKAINHVERDKECIICLEPFNFTNKKPILICLQQHLICEDCLQRQSTLNDCPLCRDEIVRSKVVACRERLKTMRLEQIISEKYQIKLQKCLMADQKDIDQANSIKKQPQLIKKKQPEQPKTIVKKQPEQPKPKEIKKPGQRRKESSNQDSAQQSKQIFQRHKKTYAGIIPHKKTVARKVRTPQLVAQRIAKRSRPPSLKHPGNKKYKHEQEY